jgi:hypothetical protein
VLTVLLMTWLDAAWWNKAVMRTYGLRPSPKGPPTCSHEPTGCARGGVGVCVVCVRVVRGCCAQRKGLRSGPELRSGSGLGLVGRDPSHHRVAIDTEMVRIETNQGHSARHDGSACHVEEEAEAGDQEHGPLHRAGEKSFTGSAGTSKPR